MTDLTTSGGKQLNTNEITITLTTDEYRRFEASLDVGCEALRQQALSVMSGGRTERHWQAMSDLLHVQGQLHFLRQKLHEGKAAHDVDIVTQGRNTQAAIQEA